MADGLMQTFSFRLYVEAGATERGCTVCCHIRFQDAFTLDIVQKTTASPPAQKKQKGAVKAHYALHLALIKHRM